MGTLDFRSIVTPSYMPGKAKKTNQVVTREYTINLHAKLDSRQFKKRAPRAVALVRKFATRTMKTKDVRIDVKLNKHLWSKGVRNVPRKIRVAISRKRNDDEEAKDDFYSYVTIADTPDGFGGLGTKVVDEA